MLQAFVITLREGLEAFLIVAISLAYLRKTGRARLVPAIHWGIAASVLLSIAAGVLLARASNQALWEGVLALAAAVLVASLTVHMWTAGRRLKRDIEGRLEASSVRAGKGAFLGVFAFTLLMITREGMETALLMNALLFQVRSMQIVSGALAGTLVAAGIAFLWSRYGHRVNLARFFQVTAVFLFVFVIQLLIYGFHELSEANIFPGSQAWHDATEPYGPDGVYGQYPDLPAGDSADRLARGHLVLEAQPATIPDCLTSTPNFQLPTPNSQITLLWKLGIGSWDLTGFSLLRSPKVRSRHGRTRDQAAHRRRADLGARPRVRGRLSRGAHDARQCGRCRPLSDAGTRLRPRGLHGDGYRATSCGRLGTSCADSVPT